MSRRRYLSTEISTDKIINRLAVRHGDFAALFYTWLIPHAEDDASFSSDPEELMMRICPGRRDKSEADIQAVIDVLLELGLIERGSDERRLRFPAQSFYKYQSYIKGDRRGSTEVAQNIEDEALSAQISANQRATPQIIASSSSSSSSSSSDSDTGAAAPTPHPIKSAKASRIACLVDAFREAGLPDPHLPAPQAKAALNLLADFAPSEVAECVGDVRANRWGDGWLRENLSFTALLSNSRIANWRNWVEQGRPAPPSHNSIGGKELSNDRHCKRSAQGGHI